MIELVLGYRAPQSLAYRRGVHPELAYEPPRVLGVTEVGDVLRRGVPARLFAEAAREVAVPDLPVVHVALAAVVVVVSPEGAAWPVGGLSVELGDDARQELVVVERAGYGGILAVPEGAVVYPLVLVVAAPQGQAGVAPQAPDLVAGLGLDLRDEGAGFFGVDGAGEHEVLPDEEAHRVAQVVEDVVFVDAPAPDSQHVHVGLARRPNEVLVTFVGNGAHEGVSGDPVRAAGEDRCAVKHEPEEASPRLVRIGRLV